VGLVQRLPASGFDTGKATGGVTTAIAPRHQGNDALVLDRAEVMAEIGAGIQIADATRSVMAVRRCARSERATAVPRG
jgi:salicylate hydroxylase